MSAKTETLVAWLPDYYVHDAHRAESLPVGTLSFLDPRQCMEKHGWVKVGTAKVTVTYFGADATREKAADSIRAQMADAAAKYQAMQTELQERLNKLLAIGCEVGV